MKVLGFEGLSEQQCQAEATCSVLMKTDPVLPGKELREHPEPAVNPDIYSLSAVRAVY